MKPALDFLKKQQLMSIGCTDEKGPWIASVYYGIDERGSIYFISRESSRHGAAILANPQIAFTVAWFDPADHKNRKAVQGLGTCRIVKDERGVEQGVLLHNQNFPEFKERITVEWVHENEWGSRVWVIEPSYMKYWDDELYGDDESEEFFISNNK